MKTKLTETIREKLAAIQWDRGYFTNEENETIKGLANPFKLDRLAKQVDTLKEAIKALEWGDYDWPDEIRAIMIKKSETGIGLRRALLCAESALFAENSKPAIDRFHGVTSKGEDDAWRVWAVLTHEGSAIFNSPEKCAELWAAWGFDPSSSPLSDYSPTGQMFSRSLCSYSVGSSTVLCQSGARDV
jgi:hypothetical protein